MHFNVGQEQRAPVQVDPEQGGRVRLASDCIHPQENQPPGHPVLGALAHPHAMVHRGVPVLKVPEGVQDPVRDHGQGVVPLVELPLPARVGDHPLHHIVLGHQVGEHRALLAEMGLDLRQLKHRGHPVVEHDHVARQDGEHADRSVGPDRQMRQGVAPQGEGAAQGPGGEDEEAQPCPQWRYGRKHLGEGGLPRLRQEHAGAVHVAPILVPELAEHAALLVPGQEVIHPHHQGPERNHQEPGPQDRQPQAGQCESEILRVTDVGVETAERDALQSLHHEPDEGCRDHDRPRGELAQGDPVQERRSVHPPSDLDHFMEHERYGSEAAPEGHEIDL